MELYNQMIQKYNRKMKTKASQLKAVKRWKRDNPEKVKLSKRKSMLKKYGVTIESYNEMLSKQNNSCNICLLHESEFKNRLSVDHCHKTGRVRGLLCHKCNTMLGKWKDDKEKFERAAAHLAAAPLN